MEKLLRDLKFGFRLLYKSPGFSIVSILALALGIGSVTTQFSVLNGAFFRGLPFEDAQELVHLERINVEREDYNAEVPIPEFLEWQRQQDTMEDIGAFYMGTANLTVNHVAQRYDGAFLTANSFDILLAKPHLGRGLKAEDDLPDSPDVVVLGYGIWTTDFGGDPSVVGKSAIINGRSTTIVGVMEEGFAFPIQQEIWIPMGKQQDMPAVAWGDHDVITLEVIGRLKDGVSIDQAAASMSTIVKRIEQAHPESNEGYRSVEIKPYIEEFLGDQTMIIMSIMFVITIMILLIACTNVANLLFARSIRRSKELAIRSALGATRQGIIRQMITESLLLAFFGALLGMIISHYSIEGILRERDNMGMPFWFDFGLDWRILIIITISTITAGVLSGLIPAIRASKQNFNVILKDDTRTGTSLQLGWFIRTLVIGQVTLSCVILVVVVLMVRSFQEASSIKYDFDGEGTLSARMGLFEEIYPTAEDRSQFIDELTTRLEARPEIASVGFSSRYRFLGGSWINYLLPGETFDENDRTFVPHQYVTEGFLEATGLQLYGGRFFTYQDRLPEAEPVVMINQSFAQREWKDKNPLGERIMVGDPKEGEEEVWHKIVGIVGSMMEQGINNDHDGAAMMLPLKQGDVPAFITVVASGSTSSGVRLPILREEISKLDNNLPLYAVGTPAELIGQDTRQFRFLSGIFSQFGILAVFLSAIGIYGVIMFSVNQKTAEYGIRQALGATPKRIFRLVYKGAFAQLLMGFGIALVVLSPLYLIPNLEAALSNIFFNVSPEDIINYGVAFGIVGSVLLAAAMPPAFRAARILPAKALRHD